MCNLDYFVHDCFYLMERLSKRCKVPKDLLIQLTKSELILFYIGNLRFIEND